jgi:hypothetical protein
VYFPRKTKATCGHGMAYSLGLCRNCYERQLRKRNPAFVERQLKNCRQWCKRNPDKKRNGNKCYRTTNAQQIKRKNFLRGFKKYNITEQEYLCLLKQQNGKCIICGRKPSKKKRLHIDHCHKSNWIRGLLCFRCNFGIGWFLDNAKIFEKVFHYLRGDMGWYKKIKNKKKLKNNKFNSTKINIGFKSKKEQKQ